MKNEYQKLKGIAVDLDGTLTKTDMFFEGMAAFIRQHPFNLLLILWWFRHGRAFLKWQLSQRIKIRADLLPYRYHVLQWLRILRQRNPQLPVIIITGSTVSWAQPVVDFIGKELVDEVIGTNENMNCIGKNKVKYLNRRFGEHSYAYAGDSLVDLAVFRHSGHAVVIGTDLFFDYIKGQLASHKDLTLEHLTIEKNYIKGLISSIHGQKVFRNILFFMPPILMLFILSWINIVQALSFTFIVALCSSAYFMLKDMLNLEKDRQNLETKYSAMAAGDFPISLAMVFISLFLCTSLIIFLISFI